MVDGRLGSDKPVQVLRDGQPGSRLQTAICQVQRKACTTHLHLDGHSLPSFGTVQVSRIQEPSVCSVEPYSSTPSVCH